MNEELKVIISAEVSKFKEGISSAQEEVSKFNKTIGNSEFQNGIGKVKDTVNKGMKVATGAVVAGTTAMVGFGLKTASSADTIDKMSQRLGVSRKTYQELDYVLSQSGSDINSFGVGVKTLTANMDKASEGNKTAVANFDKLGVSVVDSNGKLRSQEDVLKDTIIAFQNMEDGTEKSRLATELFGKQGQEIIPLLNGEAGSFEELSQKANDLGLIMSDSVIDKGVAMTDAMDTMKRGLGAVGSEIGAVVMPYITQFCDYLTSNLPQIREVISGLIEKAQQIGSFIQEHIGLIASIVAVIGTAIAIINGICAVITIYNAVTGIASIVTAGAVAPVLAVIAVISLLVGAIVFAITHWEQIKEVVSKVWNAIKEKVSSAVASVKDAMSNAWEKIKSVTSSVWNGIKSTMSSIWEGIKSAVTNAVNGVKSTISNVWNAIKSTIDSILNGIKSTVSSVWEGIKSTVTNVVNGIKSGVTSGFNAIKSTVSSVTSGISSAVSSAFNAVKNTISNAINGAKNVVSSGLSAIKGFFSSCHLQLPQIKLPHFSISGSFSLSPPSIPHIGVSWYAKGGVFDSTTLFPFGGGIGGLGEDGAEAIVPLEKNTQWLDRIATMLSDKMGTGMPITLTVDGKVFAETTVRSLNDLTRQRGSLPLVFA